ncbi:MAG: bifunctional 5,10-methylenetetrahydrofolate dehydrogenase/5,10-methenyltetrahydrofolate cyclohydrolase [Candidatus Delongbacteria bacterium]|nr:bifunctional 5,10-methylenetetrahydrofolate dehydrogenase/5,10-methenyltetrahydrofolate cyclohydrolase [Candidatus Delongbacteria bacterium]
MSILLKGGPIAKVIRKEIKAKIEKYISQGIIPTLGVLIAGNDPAVEVYTAMIEKNCEKVGAVFKLYRFSENINTEKLASEIVDINRDPLVHGLIMMLPLWSHIDEKIILNTISPDKDIDGVHPVNAGKNVLGEETFVPSTAQASKDILNYSQIEVSGKHVVIVGRSNIVGKPLANLLIQKAEGANATVTVCHSRTKNLKDICRSADILIAAIGSPNFITEEFTNPDQVIVDVGMNESIDKEGNYILTGDVDFNSVNDKVAAVTPVPGGVSPLTNTALLNNLLKAVEIQTK